VAATQQHPEFITLRAERIPEIESDLTLFEHKNTGARLLSVRNTDDNRVFAVTFPTPPEDSTGLPHILEHSVLCGSERYRVKEPFVELMKGSVNTFLNAMTYPDRTCYPVASQNLKDLRNLIEVYLDAVLHPLIPPRVLEQEGWHYELDGEGRAGGAPEGEGRAGGAPDLRLKGVVYNEMKGVYSNPDALLGRYSRMSLLPDTPYAHDSGGDPRHIPDLTYKAFRAFHSRFYHPSNALVYFSGDDPETERLDLIARVFDGYGRAPAAPPVPLQPRWDGARVARERYAAGSDPATAKSMITVDWLLRDHADPERSLGLNILSEILLGTPASPLRRALIESGLGEGLAHSGLDDDIREASFSAGLKGISADDAGRIEELIRSTLAGLARDGIHPDTVAAAMNTVEFALRENNTGPYPRGLILMLRCLPGWMYLGDPFLPLSFAAPLRSIRERLARGERYFEDLVRTDLVDNLHTSVMLLEPDAELGRRQEQEERERLEALRARMSPADVEAVRARASELDRFQKTPDNPADLARIPTLALADLEREVKRIPLEIVNGPVPILVHEIPTNGIVYLDIGFDLQGLDPALLKYLPLYSRCLTEMGTRSTDFVSLQQRIGRDTGGISASLMTSAVVGSERAATWLFLRGKCLVPQLDALLDLVAEIAGSVRLDDRTRFRQMVLESKARGESSVIPAGHSLVGTRLGSKFDQAGWVREQTSGVEQLFFVRELAGRVDSQWPSVEAELNRLHAAVVTRKAAIANLTVGKEDRVAAASRLAALLDRLPDVDVARGPWSPDWQRHDEGFTAPTQVNFAGKGGRLYDLGYRLHGSVFAVLKHLRTTWIWDRVRVQGGAYGGMMQFDPISGFLAYLSYRDPNLLDTLQIYDATPGYLESLDLPREELAKSIIGAAGDMEPCLLPDAAGFTSLRRHLTGLTDAERQRLRDELLAATADDFRSFARALEAVSRKGVVVALGSAERVEEANTALGGRLHVTAVL
jgi:hypothetical protein